MAVFRSRRWRRSALVRGRWRCSSSSPASKWPSLAGTPDVMRSASGKLSITTPPLSLRFTDHSNPRHRRHLHGSSSDFRIASCSQRSHPGLSPPEVDFSNHEARVTWICGASKFVRVEVAADDRVDVSLAVMRLEAVVCVLRLWEVVWWVVAK